MIRSPPKGLKKPSAKRKKTNVKSDTSVAARKAYSKPFVSQGLGFPKMQEVCLRYSETVTLNTSIGTVATYIWSANGMFDPNITGTGHQPYYFDQYMGIYDHYCVTKSKFVVTFAAKPSEPVVQVCCFVDDDASVVPSFPDRVQENSSGIMKTVTPGGSASPFITRYWSAAKYFSKDPITDNSLQGTSSANPTEQSYFCVSTYAPDLTASSTVVSVLIEYTATLKELKDINQS